MAFSRNASRAALGLAALAVAMVAFSWLHTLVGKGAAASAAENARALLSLERFLGLDVELPVNRWLAERPVLAQAAVFYYRLYYLPLAAVVLRVVFFRWEVFPAVLRTLVVMAALALLVFWLLPVAPPRYVLPGTVDVVFEHDLFRDDWRDQTKGNHFSAMPSMHVGWSALGAYAAWLAGRRAHPRLAPLAWLFPAGMVLVVVATANHYVLDVVGSALLLAVSVAAATLWGRLAAKAAKD